MATNATAPAPAVLSYYTLQKTVGIIALSLPFVLAGGTIVESQLRPAHVLPEPVVQRSISDYYYTPARNVLVGSLCAIATILICSRGYELRDEVTGWVAGLATLGVALCPSVNPQTPGRYTTLEWNLGLAHAAFASVMFLALAYFCLVLFRKSAPGRKPTRAKLRRNKLYTVCGVVIMLCNVVMASQLAPSVYRILMPYYPLFCSETLALAAFGVAWLTKGNGILKDRPPKQPEL